jgi:hypothetical protein
MSRFTPGSSGRISAIFRIGKRVAGFAGFAAHGNECAQNFQIVRMACLGGAQHGQRLASPAG